MLIYINIQFTNDLKKIFFVEELLTGSSGTLASWTFNLYMANGHTGEIRRLLTDKGGVPFRVTSDGRFVLFQSLEHNLEFVRLFLFDVEKEIIVGEFEWIVERQPEWPHQGWTLLRFDNIFRIYETGEFGIILAVAELDPATMELKILDFSFMPDSPFPPCLLDENWLDDVMLLRQNPAVENAVTVFEGAASSLPDENAASSSRNTCKCLGIVFYKR